MKISGSPAERLPDRVSGAARPHPRRERRFATQAEEQGLVAAAYVEPRDRGGGRNRLAVCDFVAHRLAVDLQDQIALAHACPVGAAAQIDAADAHAATMVAVVLRRIFHRESERLLIPAEPWRRRARLPGSARLLPQHDRDLQRLARPP